MQIFNHIPMDLISQFSYVLLTLLTIVAVYYDIKDKKIPNWVPVDIFIIWVIAGIIKYLVLTTSIVDAQTRTIIFQNVKVEEVLPYLLQGGVAAFSVIALLWGCVWVVNNLRKVFKKKEQTVLGWGDIKILAAISLYFGYVGSFICIFIACITFVIYYALLSATGGKRKNGYPFAPFILIGLIAAIVTAYLVLFFA